MKASQAIALLLHTLKGVRNLVLVVGTLLALFQVVLIAVARSLENSGQFAQLGALMPPFVRALLGPAFASFLSFGGIVSLGYFEPAVLGAAVGLAITVGTRLALEVESGFLDLILARPVPRHWIVTRSIIVVVVSIVAVITLMVAGTWSGLAMLTPATAERPSSAQILTLAAELGLLSLCWGGIALMISAVSRRRGTASAISGLLALVAFLLDYVGQLWKPAEAVSWISPFEYFRPLDLVMGGGLPVTSLTVLAAIGVASFFGAYVLFLRRDISR